MEIYFLKSAACFAILLLFYKLLLEKENMHVLKRIYLLSIPFISFGIPFITFPEYVEISAEALVPFSATEDMGISEKTAEFPFLEWLGLGIYLLGVLFFGSRFILNLKNLLIRARKNPQVKIPGATQVLLKDEVDPHTFWSYIYLNRKKFQKNHIPKEVLDHEMAHARQKHTADVIFMELLQIFLWFLPLVYLLKKAVKLNHEFLADREVIQKASDPKIYQQVLLSFSSGENCSLVNSINYQSIKKRFTVMKKEPSLKAVLVRTFIFLPLLAILLYSFSAREAVLLDQGSATQVLQEKATPEMVAEYNSWAKALKEDKGEKAVTKAKLDRMRYIYKLMTPQQKKDSESFPDIEDADVIVDRRNERNKRAAVIRERMEERSALRQERQALREERRAVREEREVERAERREMEIQRRVHRDIPSPPPPPPAPPVHGDVAVPSSPPLPEHAAIPAPPPPPPSPEEAIKGWIEEGAEFFYNGKPVSGQEALKAVQENNGKNLSVQVQDTGSGKTVRISDNKR